MSAMADTCPYGLCDGTGFVVDEDDARRRAVPLPAAARRAPPRAAASAP